MAGLRILTINHEFPPVGGGASTICRELARRLVRKGHQVDVVTMHFKGTQRFENIAGVNVYRTPALRKRANIGHAHELASYLPGAMLKIRQLVRDNQYDIIHCHFMVPGGLLAGMVSRMAGIPYIVTCHGSDVPGYNPDRFNLMHKLISPVWKRLARKTPLLTTPSEYLKKLVLKTCPEAKVCVIPNGIDIGRFRTTNKTNDILMCGRVLAYKGFQHVINAVKDIKLNWTLNLLGDGPYLPDLKKLAQHSMTSVKFWGWLDKDDPRFMKLYNDSAIFVIPSEAENFPTVTLEAMSAKMAIISSNVGGCTEIIGDAGLVTVPGDIEAIRKHLLLLVDSDSQRQKYSDMAFERVQQFSWDAITDRFIEVYERLRTKTS